MSDEASHRAPPQEPENVHAGALSLAGLAVLVLFAITVVTAGSLHTHWAGRTPASSEVTPAMRREENNELYAMPFPLERRGIRERQAQRRRLNSYGWVDRRRGVIHVPLEAAERELLERGEKRGER